MSDYYDPINQPATSPSFPDQSSTPSSPNSGRGGAGQSNAAYRAARREFRRRCNAAGGFPTQDNQCLIGQEAIDHIEGLGENHPAYERGQQWLNDNPVDVTEDDSTQDSEGDILDGFFEQLLQDANETNAGFTPDGYVEEVEESFEDDVIDPTLTGIAPNTTIGGGDANPIAGIIDDVKEAFPTFEDLWAVLRDKLPNDPKEWGDVIRGVLDAAGVPILNSDPSAILQGGYGVRWDPASSVFTYPSSGTIFVPGIPVGLPPSSVDIGTIEDLLNRPGTIVENVGNIIKDTVGGIINDPIGAAGQILAGAIEVPPELWGVLLGGIEAGKDFIDWIGDTFGSDTQTQEPPLGAPPPDSEEEGDPANRFQQLLEQTEEARGLKGDFVAPEQDLIPPYEGDPQSRFGGLLGAVSSVRPEGVQEQIAPEYSGSPSSRFGGLLGAVSEVRPGGTDMPPPLTGGDDDPLSGAENTDNTPYSGGGCLTFGGGSCADGSTPTNIFTGTENEFGEEQTPLAGGETLLSGGVGGGGGAARGGGDFNPFMSGINYQTPQVAPIIQSPRVASLFERFIG